MTFGHGPLGPVKPPKSVGRRKLYMVRAVDDAQLDDTLFIGVFHTQRRAEQYQDDLTRYSPRWMGWSFYVERIDPAGEFL